MGKIIAICAKELKDYFFSPIAYIILSIFLLITGWFFFSTFFIINQASLRDFFDLLPFVFAFIIPAISMKIFSEEFNLGSYEILITLPLKITDIVLGKFLSLIILVIILLIPTISYPIWISFLGELDLGPIFGGYIGAIFLGSAFSAIGMFSSSLTKNQINSFIIATLICLFLTLVNKILFFLPEQLVDIFNYFSASYHFQNFAKGIIDLRDIIYFSSVAFIFLYLTYLSLISRQ